MLHSHKDGILYLEHCKVSSSDDRLTFSRYEDAVEKFWSIPYAATGCILLGPGTSLTHKAAKFLSSEGVMSTCKIGAHFGLSQKDELKLQNSCY